MRMVPYEERDGLIDAAIPVSPELAERLREALSQHDTLDDAELLRTVGLVLDRLMERLPEEQRIVLHLSSCGQSLNQIARFMGWALPDRSGAVARQRPRQEAAWDRKRVSRTLVRAKQTMHTWLTSTEWIVALLGHPETQEA